LYSPRAESDTEAAADGAGAWHKFNGAGGEISRVTGDVLVQGQVRD
jgi:hypothetical protein